MQILDMAHKCNEGCGSTLILKAQILQASGRALEVSKHWSASVVLSRVVPCGPV